MPKNITFEIGGKPYSVTWNDPSEPTPADIDEMETAVRTKYKLPLAKPASTGPTPGNGSMLRPPQGMLPIDATVKSGPVAIPQPKAVDPMLAGLIDTSKLKGITGNGVSPDEETRNRAQGRTTDQRNRAVLVQTQDQRKQPLLSRSQVNAAAIIKANKARQINKPISPSANPNYTEEEDAATAYGQLPMPNTSRGSSSDIGRKMAQRGLNKVTGGVVTALMPGIAGAMNDKDRAKFAEGIGEGANRLANDAAMFFVPGYGGAVIGYQVAPMIGESLKTGSTQPLIDGIGGFAEGLNVTGDKPLYDRVQAGINLVLTAVGIGHGVTKLRAMHDGFSTGRITAKQIAEIAKEDPRVYQILTEAGYKPKQIADIVNQSAEITAPEVSNKPKITGTERPAPILGQSRGATVTPKPTTESTVRPNQTSTPKTEPVVEAKPKAKAKPTKTTQNEFTYFHKTPKENVEAILSNGFKPSESGELGPGVYLANDANLVSAKKFDGQETVAAKVKGKFFDEDSPLGLFQTKLFQSLPDAQRSAMIRDARGKGDWSSTHEFLKSQGYDGIRRFTDGKPDGVLVFDAKNVVPEPAPAAPVEYHGTSKTFKSFQKETPTFLTSSKSEAANYATGGGGGRQTSVPANEAYFVTEGKSHYADNGDGTLKRISKGDDNAPESLTVKQAQDMAKAETGNWVPKNARVLDVAHNIPKTRILDANTPEGWAIIKRLQFPTKGFEKILGSHIQSSDAFHWDLTKDRHMQNAWMQVAPQLKALGYDAIRFNEGAYSKDNPVRTTMVLTPESIKVTGESRYNPRTSEFDAPAAPVEAAQPTKPVTPVKTPKETVTPAQAKPKEPWEMTREEYAKKNPLPLQPTLPKNDSYYTAVVTDDGSIYTLPGHTLHQKVIDFYKIPKDRVVDGGWIENQDYRSSGPGGDSPRIGKKAREERDVTHLLSVVESLQKGKPVPAEVLADYPDLAAKYGKQRTPNEQTNQVRQTRQETSQPGSNGPESAGGVNRTQEAGQSGVPTESGGGAKEGGVAGAGEPTTQETPRRELTPKELAAARILEADAALDQALNRASRRTRGRQAGSFIINSKVLEALTNSAKARIDHGVESVKEWLGEVESKYGKLNPAFVAAVQNRSDEIWEKAGGKPTALTEPVAETPKPAKPTPLTGTTESVVTGDKIKAGEATTPKKRVRASETNPNNVTGARHSLMDQDRLPGTTIEQHAKEGEAKLNQVGESGVMDAVHASNESGKPMTHAEASAAQIIQNNIERRSRALEAKGITSGAEIEKLIAQKQAVNRALKIYGHEFNTIGTNLQQARDMHGSLVNFLTAMQDAKGEKLTPSEHKDYTAMYQQIAELQAKVDAHEANKADLEKQLAAEKAKKNIETLRTENAARSKGRKDTAEAINARKVEALRKGFRALQGQTSLMGFDRLAAAAPHFKDAAVELGKQGKVKLSDVVDSLVTEAKVAGIKVTEREVLGMLAGEYDPKPNKAKERVESIRTQAQKELQTETRNLERKVKATEYVEQQAKASMDRAQRETIKAKEFAKKKAAAADAKFHADQARRQLAALKKIQAAADKEWNLKDKIKMGEAKLKARKELQQARAEYAKEWKNSIHGKREALFERLQAAESALMSPPQAKTPKPKLPPELLDLTIKLNAAKFKAKQLQERVQAKADYDLLTQGEKNKEAANQLLGTSRTALTSIDRSAMLRQAFFLAISHARIIPKVIMDQYHAGKSEVNYTQVMGDVMTNPYFDKALNAELDLGGLTGRRGGEFFRSDLLSRPVEVKGRDVNAFARSERAYDAAIVSTRMQAFALDVHALEKLHGRGLDIDELKLVAEHINQVSGSGTGPTAQHLKGLVGSNLFAPGYLVSKFQTATGAALRKAIAHGKKTGDYSIAKVQAMNYAKFLASAGAAAYLLSDDHDSKSSRFLTRRIGNQRVNLMGGLQQPLIMFSQLAFGTTDAKGKHHPPDWEKTFGNFATGKEGVGFRVAQSIAEKKSYGKNTDIKTLEGAGNIAKSMFVPISIQNAQDIWSDPKLSTIEKAALTTAAYFGVDVNQQPKEDEAKSTSRNRSRGNSRSRGKR